MVLMSNNLSMIAESIQTTKPLPELGQQWLHSQKVAEKAMDHFQGTDYWGVNQEIWQYVGLIFQDFSSHLLG